MAKIEIEVTLIDQEGEKSIQGMQYDSVQLALFNVAAYCLDAINYLDKIVIKDYDIGEIITKEFGIDFINKIEIVKKEEVFNYLQEIFLTFEGR